MNPLCAICGLKPPAPRRRACDGCRSRQDRERNPIRYTFENLRFHAKARAIPFDLSLEEWSDFCNQTGYHEKRGNGPEDLTVDRVEAGNRLKPGPYCATNINILTRRENSIKGNIEKQARQAKWDNARRLLSARR